VQQPVYIYKYDPLIRGYLVYATAWVTAPKKVNVVYGDILRVYASFSYTGPKFTAVLYGAIGTPIIDAFGRKTGFDEIIFGKKEFSLAETPTEKTITETVDIEITTALAAGHNYSLYVKIQDRAGRDLIISNYLQDAIYVVEVRPEFKQLEIVEYKVV